MVSIRSKVLNYDFYNRVNFIGGYKDIGLNSAGFKTTLYERLLERDGVGEVSCNMKLFFADVPSNLNGVVFEPDVCIVLDDTNFKPTEVEWLFQKARENNWYLIVIGRLLVKQMCYLENTVYSIENDRYPFKLRRVFKFGGNFDKEKSITRQFREAAPDIESFRRELDLDLIDTALGV